MIAMHPGKPPLVMTQYRKHILACKRKMGSARGLIHYKRLVETYLWAKRVVIGEREA
jgi:hypothetical protein